MSDKIDNLRRAMRARLEIEQYDEAIANCKKILDIDGTDWEAAFIKGYCLAGKKRTLDTESDVRMMKSNVERCARDVSLLKESEREVAYRMMAERIIAYADSCLKEVHEYDGTKFQENQLKKRANAVFMLIPQTEEILKSYSGVSTASLILHGECTRMRRAYGMISDVSEGKAKAVFGEKSKGATPLGTLLILALLAFVIWLAFHVQEQEPIEEDVPVAGEYTEAMEEVEEYKGREKTPEGFLPVAYYENDMAIGNSDTVYVSDSLYEQIMDNCRFTTLNPTLLVGDKLYHNKLSLKPCDGDMSAFEELGMIPRLTDVDEEEMGKDRYSFDEEGSQQLFSQIIKHMCQSQMFESHDVDKIYQDVFMDLPEFTYADEKKPCYFAYVQIRFEGMTYLYQVYMHSENGDTITKVSAEMIGARYLKAKSEDAQEYFRQLDAKILADQLLFVEATEHVLTGTHQINDYLAPKAKRISSVERNFKADGEKWKEYIRFYASSTPGGELEEWKDSKLYKCEICVETRE